MKRLLVVGHLFLGAVANTFPPRVSIPYQTIRFPPFQLQDGRGKGVQHIAEASYRDHQAGRDRERREGLGLASLSGGCLNEYLSSPVDDDCLQLTLPPSRTFMTMSPPVLLIRKLETEWCAKQQPWLPPVSGQYFWLLTCTDN